MRARIEAYLERLYGFAYALTQDPDAARDLVQECAVRALDAGRVPYDEPAYRAWLFRILRNAFIDRNRRSGKETGLEPDIDEPDDRDAGWCGDSRIIDVLTVRFAVARLPSAHREIIALVDFVGLSYQEASEVLGVAQGTVMSRVSRARKALLAEMEAGNVTPISRARSRMR
ncbi:MAG: RNA polymerase sigma factor [Bauldia sp.]|nr:RNA polymerase sigma factor [Bauldia sp.]